MMERYNSSKINRDSNGKRYLSFIKYPKIPFKLNDIYLYSVIGDRVDKLAMVYYKDKSLWWIISIANDIPKDSFNIPPGTQIRVPMDINSILNQYKVINNR